MGNIYVTSDLHFGHDREFVWKARGYNSIEEMNEDYVHKWNSTVSDEDDVYVLGDLMLGDKSNIEYIKRLNGKIILIRGNHDTPKRIEAYKEIGIEVHDIFYLPYKGRYFILCHFPIANEEFIRMVIEDNSEVVNLYGHVHSNAPLGYNNGTYHVGVDTNNLAPISLEQIWRECWPEKQMENPFVSAYYDVVKDNPNFEN